MSLNYLCLQTDTFLIHINIYKIILYCHNEFLNEQIKKKQISVYLICISNKNMKSGAQKNTLCYAITTYSIMSKLKIAKNNKFKRGKKLHFSLFYNILCIKITPLCGTPLNFLFKS